MGKKIEILKLIREKDIIEKQLDVLGKLIDLKHNEEDITRYRALNNIHRELEDKIESLEKELDKAV